MADNTETELEDRARALAEAFMDHLNETAETPNAPAMLTSYALIVEGNGWTQDGEPVTRGMFTSLGSGSQVKGLLIDTLDQLRAQDLDL